MGTKLKVMLLWVALGFALVLTLGLSFFVYASSNENLNLSGSLAYEPSINVVKYYWGEMDNPSGNEEGSYYNQHVKLFSNNTFEAQIATEQGDIYMIMIIRGDAIPTSEETFQYTATYCYGYQRENGEVVMEIEWNEGEEVPEGMEFASMLNELHIRENVAFFGDYPPMFENSYTPSGSALPIAAYMRDGSGRDNIFYNCSGQETISQIESDGRLFLFLDAYNDDGDFRNLGQFTYGISFTVIKLDGVGATGNTVVSLGYHTAEVSFEYNSQTYTMTVDFVTTSEK